MIEPDRYWRIARLLLSEGGTSPIRQVPAELARHVHRTSHPCSPKKQSPLVFPKRMRTARSRPVRVFLVAASSRSTFLPPSSLPSRACSLQTRPNTPHYPNIPIPLAFSTFQGSHLKAKRWQVTKVTTEVTEGQPHVRQLSKHKTHSDHLVGWLAGGLTDCFARQAALA